MGMPILHIEKSYRYFKPFYSVLKKINYRIFDMDHMPLNNESKAFWNIFESFNKGFLQVTTFKLWEIKVCKIIAKVILTLLAKFINSSVIGNVFSAFVHTFLGVKIKFHIFETWPLSLINWIEHSKKSAVWKWSWKCYLCKLIWRSCVSVLLNNRPFSR